MLISRNVGYRIKRGDSGKGSRGKFGAGHVRLDEGRRGDVATRQVDLASRSIDAGHGKPAVLQITRDRQARAASEIEHANACRQSRDQLIEPELPNRRTSKATEVDFGNTVIASRDD